MLTEIKKIPFTSQSYDEVVFENLKRCLQKQEYENGYYTKQAASLLKEISGCNHILLTHSCTAALEMSALLHDIGPNDEIIMPSFTFVSTANAFALRGAKPVFVDINPLTLNLDENLVEKAITPRTRAIVPVHYAGMSCNMDILVNLATKYKLLIIEDAAQSIGARYKGQHLGTFGSLAGMSFHYTKNISAGFGGALFINDGSLIDKAKIILQRGTNREAFLEGQVDKYTWTGLGSSYVLPELSAALLASQLSNMEEINKSRLILWRKYFNAFKELEDLGLIKLPKVCSYSENNAHIFYFLIQHKERANLMKYMKDRNIQLTTHYQPLHLSQFYIREFEKIELPETEKAANKIVRFPLYFGLTEKEHEFIIDKTLSFFKNNKD